MNNLKLLRKKKGLNQDDLAKILNCTSMTISRYESGKNEISNENLKKLSEYFGVSTDFILGIATEQNTDPVTTELASGQKEIDKPSAPTFSADTFYAPLVATLRCGYHDSGEPIYDELQKIELPASFKHKYGKDIVLIKAIGESMLPLIRPRDMLICKPGTEWIDGNIVVVNVDDSDTVKRIYRAKDGGIDLVPENPSYKKMHFTPEDLIAYPPHVLGRVVRNYGQDL